MSMRSHLIDISQRCVDFIDRFFEYVEKKGFYRQVWSICRLLVQMSDPGPNSDIRWKKSKTLVKTTSKGETAPAPGDPGQYYVKQVGV